MPHCDPAPPHPEPGQVYQVICPPGVEEMAVLLGILGIILVIAIATPDIGRRELNRQRVDAAAHRDAEGYP